MAQGTTTGRRFNLEKLIWGLVLIGCLFVIISPLYIMLKYSVSDKDAIVTGGKYPIPLWPFDPNMDQYRELIGATCYKLTPESLENLTKAGLPEEVINNVSPMADGSCNQKSAFVTLLDKRLQAAHRIDVETQNRLTAEGLPEPLLTLLGNLQGEKPASATRFLRQVEKQTSLKLTTEGIAKLKTKGVPADVADALGGMVDTEYLLAADFMAAAEKFAPAAAKHRKRLLRTAAYAKVERLQVVQHKRLLLDQSFVGWQNGKIDPTTTEKYRTAILKEAGGGWSIGRKDFWIAGLYSLEIAILTVAFSILIGAPAAFTLARYKFPGLAVLMFCIISIRLFPDICSVVPVAEAFAKPPLALIPPLLQVAAAHTLLSLPYVIYILMGVFKTIPKDLEEQAYILGATKLYTFRHVIIPVALTGLAAASIYVFLLSWNEFIFSYFLLFKSPHVSLPVYLLRILAWTPQPNFLAAISMMLSLPVIVFAFAVQRYMISGMTAGAVK